MPLNKESKPDQIKLFQFNNNDYLQTFQLSITILNTNHLRSYIVSHIFQPNTNNLQAIICLADFMAKSV